MSKNYAIIIQCVLPLTKFYWSGAQRNNVYKRDAFVTSWRSHNRAWQPRRHDRLSETSGTLRIHRGALTNQRCSLATGCGIKFLRRILWKLGLSQEATNTQLILIHWGQVTHICINEPSVRCQYITCTNEALLSIQPQGRKYYEIWFDFQTFSITKMHMKMTYKNVGYYV